MVLLAEKGPQVPRELRRLPQCAPARTHTRARARTKVEATTSAFPRWGSLRKSLLPLQDFPTLAQAPPLPEPGSSPSTECPPEQRLGGGGEWAPLAAIGCAAVGRREASRCALRPPVRPSRAQHRCAPPFPPTASPAQIGETRGVREELDAAPSHPELGSRRGTSARPDPQVSEGLPTPPASAGRGVGAEEARGAEGWRGLALCPRHPDSSPGAASGPRGSAPSRAASQTLPGSQRLSSLFWSPPNVSPSCPRAASAARLCLFSG